MAVNQGHLSTRMYQLLYTEIHLNKIYWETVIGTILLQISKLTTFDLCY